FTSLTTYLDLARRRGAGTHEPPPARSSFRQEFKKLFLVSASGTAIAEANQPRIEDQGFAELRIYFPSSFLFGECEVEPRDPAVEELGRFRDFLNRYDKDIERIQITGHTDRDPPSRYGLCFAQGIKTNWQLSARRAITIAEQLAPEDGKGVAPAKVWPTALGPHHPAISSGPEVTGESRNQRDRRIEVLIKFRESGSVQATK
ncbi:MAG TPA: OmpA family protein, partial [Thermoanaerobaculia bacterium]|nr:OmpA family protein [Thermoanaerobaculia bacterium]